MDKDQISRIETLPDIEAIRKGAQETIPEVSAVDRQNRIVILIIMLGFIILIILAIILMAIFLPGAYPNMNFIGGKLGLLCIWLLH